MNISVVLQATTRIALMVICLGCFSARPAFSQRGSGEFPSVTLPPDLDRVLRDYERGWQGSEPETLALLFTEDGFAMPSGRPPVRGRRAIEEEYRRAQGALILRAVAYSVSDSIGYIIGAYRYDAEETDRGKFVLALRRDMAGRWLIAADIDNGNGN